MVLEFQKIVNQKIVNGPRILENIKLEDCKWSKNLKKIVNQKIAKDPRILENSKLENYKWSQNSGEL